MVPHTLSGWGQGDISQNNYESVPSAFEMFSGMGSILIIVDQQ